MDLKEKPITVVPGVKAAGKKAGIKKSGKYDLGMIYIDEPGSAAGVFTNNQVKGAPVYVTIDNIQNGKAQAVIVNSGIANTCTGEKGFEDAEKMAELTADELGIDAEDVLVFSTGVIGDMLPMDKVENGIKGMKASLSDSEEAGIDFAKSIMTTDTTQKFLVVEYDEIVIGGVAKGSGMIHPNMATMLGFLMTNADVDPDELKKMLKSSVDKSFNMISVDSDTSTNDSVIIISTNKQKTDKEKFQSALDELCVGLAKKIASDGEGATKLIEVNVKNAKTEKDAKRVAKAVVNSPLVKTMVFGADPNFGRIIGAVGYSRANINPNKIDIYVGGEPIAKDGQRIDFNYQKAKELLEKKVVVINIDLQEGDESTTAWGCDLTHGYVDINAHYTT